MDVAAARRINDCHAHPLADRGYTGLSRAADRGVLWFSIAALLLLFGRKQPSSGAFPSGHSASAAAFATGIALESPGIGLAVAPVAAAVAYSRLHTGAHWLSDVLGGVALGAAVAVVGKFLVPASAP